MVTLFVIGIVAAILVDEWTGVSPGGIIVPAFLVLSLHQPLVFGATILVGLICVGICHLAERYILLYGRRRFAFNVLTGVALKAALHSWFPLIGLLPFGLAVVGYVVPGVLAETFRRQGIPRTLGALLLATALARLAGMAVLGW